MHLVVVMHGMWGSSSHMNQIEKGICTQFPEHVILNCKRLSFFTTFQGIDNCGWRLYDDVMQFVENFANTANGGDKISSISFIGYSLGGLICRYCIGLLDRSSFFDTVRPLHMITIATPHIGTRLRHRSVSGRVINAFGSCIVNLYAGRSGEQIALLDGDAKHSIEPLLLEMTRAESYYIKGLKKFPHIYVYANASNDNTVPFCTSSLSYRNKWKTTEACKKELVDGTNDYTFILETEKIRGDIDIVDYRDKHVVKKYEWDLWNICLLLIVLLFGIPLLLVHIIFLALPLRLISFCYSFPDESGLCPRLQSSTEKPVDPDLCPWMILKNMRDELDIHRVSVMIPGAHTHGKIICRFQPNDGGLDVIRHIVKEVLSLQHSARSISGGDIDVFEENITNINIDMK